MNINGCDCNSSNLPKIGATKCGANVGQVQIAALFDMRNLPYVGTSGSEKCLLTNHIGSSSSDTDNNIVVKQNWTSVLAEETTTPKATMTPALYEFDMTPGDTKMWGEDNSTPDGRGISMGEGNTVVSTTLRKAGFEQVTNMKQAQCLAEQGNLGVLFFNEAGHVIGRKGYTKKVTVSSGFVFWECGEGDGGVESLLPLNVVRMSVASRKFGGLDEPDSNNVSITLKEGWDEKLNMVKLTDFRGLDLLS